MEKDYDILSKKSWILKHANVQPAFVYTDVYNIYMHPYKLVKIKWNTHLYTLKGVGLSSPNLYAHIK